MSALGWLSPFASPGEENRKEKRPRFRLCAQFISWKTWALKTQDENENGPGWCESCRGRTRCCRADGNQSQMATLINNPPHSRPLHCVYSKIVRVSFTLFDSLRSPKRKLPERSSGVPFPKERNPTSDSPITAECHRRVARPEVSWTCSWLEFIAHKFLYLSLGLCSVIEDQDQRGQMKF